MSPENTERRAHWQAVYERKAPAAVSWYRPHLEVSLALLESAGLSAGARLIDVGGGAATLVDDLLERGLREVTVLDVSGQALAIARARLGPRAAHVHWLEQDVLRAALPPGGFDFWHDRAVLHFLTDPAEAARYVQVCASSLASGGHALIGGFAPDGPERCSGLPVVRRSSEQLAALFGAAFSLVRTHAERHRTPAGAEQSFAYVLLRRS
jgi:SAM-dependent methyltransferase